MFFSLTSEGFHECIQPKVQGTWNIHNVSLAEKSPLDFFTLLSSICGVVGQTGQANYGAANVFLDSFALYRRRLGLPACSVDLGVIEDVGYVSTNEAVAKRLNAQNWTPINEALLHRILRCSILQQSTTTVAPAGASQLITGIPVPLRPDSTLFRDARFSGLYPNTTANSGAGEGDKCPKDSGVLFALLKAKADRASLLTATIDIVNRQLMKSLAMNEPIDPSKPLSGYGIDSLVAVEFRNWVGLELGAEITTLEIISTKTLTTLCENILAKISG